MMTTSSFHDVESVRITKQDLDVPDVGPMTATTIRITGEDGTTHDVILYRKAVPATIVDMTEEARCQS